MFFKNGLSKFKINKYILELLAENNLIKSLAFSKYLINILIDKLFLEDESFV